MKKISQFCISIVLGCMVLFFTAVPVVFAQTPSMVDSVVDAVDRKPLGDYTTLVALPGTGIDPKCVGGVGIGCKTNFTSYLPALFNLSIGIAAGMAFAVLSYGGFLYMTTDALQEKADGKKYAENAVKGLLLVIGAYAILYTINPEILNFNLNVQSPSLREALKPTIEAGTGMLIGPNGVKYEECTTCKKLDELGLPKTAGVSVGGGVVPDLGEKLQKFNTFMKEDGVSWEITEAHPPKINHRELCHQTGCTVDSRPVNQNATTINKFFTNASKAGLYAVYEVKKPEEKDALIRQGVTTGQILVVPQITGPHFSVYRNQQKN